MKRLLTVILLTFSALPAFAQPSAPLPVVASFSILGDMVKEIGGDAVKVTTLVGPDSDTHTYEPTPDDAKTIRAAKIVFVNGLGFEGWMTRLISASGYTGPVIVASNGVNPRTMNEGGQQIMDPHAWQGLSNGHYYVRNISAALEKALPDQAKAIEARAEAYDLAITNKDKWVKSQVVDIPPAKRKVITSHDAFGYFSGAYQITILAPQGYSTESEPNAADIAALIDQIKTTGIKTVFLENMTSKRLVSQLAKDAGAKVGGTLYSDALSKKDGPADSYLKMFDNNVPKMVAAMQEITPPQ